MDELLCVRNNFDSNIIIQKIFRYRCGNADDVFCYCIPAFAEIGFLRQVKYDRSAEKILLLVFLDNQFVFRAVEIQWILFMGSPGR